MALIEKYLSVKFFVALNILIIILTETVGGGTLFFKTGIIHIIAIAFVVLAFVRVYFHQYTYDPILEKFIHACLAAMAVFAFSHLVEFFSFVILGSYQDAAYANVANFYLISLLLITIGAESFLRVLHGRSPFLLRALKGAVALLVLLIIVFIVNDKLVSLELDEYTPYLYTVLIVGAVGLSFAKIRKIKHVDFMPSFINYLTISIFLIGIAALINISYEFLVDLAHFPDYQAVYLSHFAFYASLSTLFLAFGQNVRLGGMLEEVKSMRR